MRWGTDLNNADSDGDGLPDGYEVFTTGTNPLVTDSDDNSVPDNQEDSDKDGLSNLEEYQLGTDPKKADTDEDNLIDGEEVNTYTTNPLVYDTDGDSIGDGDEIKIGLNPLKTATNGVADNEYTFEQEVSDEALKYVNTEENEYKLSIDVKASGNAADNMIVASSQYANTISTNGAMIGEVISVDYFEGELEEGTLHFTLNSDIIEQPNIVDDIKLEGLKRYYVFNYNEDAGILVPVPTNYDNENNTLSASMIGKGTYCVMDLEKWMVGIGVLAESSEEVAETDTVRVLMSPTNYLAAPISNSDEAQQGVASSKQKKVDLVLVVDTGSTMKPVINSVKTGLKSIIALLTEKGLDIRVSLIDVKDMNDESISIPIKINGTDAKVAEGDESLSFTSNLEVVDNLIDDLYIEGNDDFYTLGTQFAGVSYATTLPYRKNASKSILLVTNKNSGIDNCHGFKTTKDLFAKLKEMNIDFSVATMTNSSGGEYTVLNYKRYIGWGNGVYVLLRNFTNNISTFTDFVMSNLYEEKDFTILKCHSLEEIILSEPLVKGGSTDTDQDGLTDSQEVKWGDEEYVDDAVSVKCTADGYELPYLRDLWGDISIRYGYESTEFPFWEEMADIQILPVKSDPTLKDSDDDGLLDNEDTMPFINDYKVMWSKITDSNDIYYFGQLNYSKDSLRIIRYDTKSGETTVNKLSDGLIEKISDEDFDAESLKISQEIDNVTVSEDGQVTLDLNNRDQSMVINLDPFKDFTTQIMNANFKKQQVDDFYTTEGILFGMIDSCLSPANIGVSLALNIRGDKTISCVVIPSSEEVKAGVLAIQGINECELDENVTYLKAKIATEDVMHMVSSISTAASVVAGIAKLIEGGFKFVGGVISTPATGGVSLVVAAASASASGIAMGTGLLAIGEISYSIASNSGAQANKDRSKLKGVDNTRYISNKVSAETVANKLGGTVTELKNGYKVEVPNGNKTITIRIMNEGSGGRMSPYFRVSIDGKGSLTLDGILSSDRALTHIDMTDDYLNQITDIINQYITNNR